MFKDVALLFANPLRIKILKFFLYQPDSSFSARTAAPSIGSSKQKVERELRALVRTGLLTVLRRKGGDLFTADAAHPLVPALTAFLEVSTLPSAISIARVFQGVRGLSLVVTSGALVQEPRGSVDLLVVTSRPRDPGVTRAVKRVERLMGMPLRYAILESRDYDSRLEARDRLLRDVFEFRHRVLFGRI